MNPFTRMLAALLPGRKTDEPRPEPSALMLISLLTAAGERVTPETALRNATVWACVTYLSRTVAQLPWRVMRETEAGSERIRSHPISYLLSTRPNPEMGSFTFRETLVGWAVRRGNGIAEIQRDMRGVPVALWPIHPDRYSFERDVETGELLYGVTGAATGKVLLKSSDVFHLRGYGDGPIGLDVMSYAAESLGWAQATQLFGSAYFGNGAKAAGFMMMPKGMSTAAKKLLDADIESKHGGARKSNKWVMLDADIKTEKITEAPEAAQFIETRQHQVEEICRWFGVPPHKVMHMLHATFSNIEHQSIEVVTDSITPWALRMEQEGDYKLFGQNRQGFYTKLDLNGLLRGDFKSRQEGLQIMRRNGVVNANEWRSLEDMNRIGDDGDKYIVEGNMTTLEAVGQEPVPPEPMEPQPAEPDNVVRARHYRALALVAPRGTNDGQRPDSATA